MQMTVENLSFKELQAEAERIARRMDRDSPRQARRSRRCRNRHGKLTPADVEHERHRDLEYEWQAMQTVGARPDQCVVCIRRELEHLRDKRGVYYRPEGIWDRWTPGSPILDKPTPKDGTRRAERCTWVERYARMRGANPAVRCICTEVT